jgi:hypothetical protein
LVILEASYRSIAIAPLVATTNTRAASFLMVRHTVSSVLIARRSSIAR